MDLTIAANGAYGVVGELQGVRTLEEKRARSQTQGETGQPAEEKLGFTPPEKTAPSIGLTKGLTDGAELAIAAANVPAPPAPKPQQAANAYGKQEPVFESAFDRKLREAQTEVRGVKAREVPEEADPDSPPHAEAARELVEKAQENREAAREERLEKEQRVLSILKNPELHGFPKDV